jgi:ubiquinone/menaquinone biosynthesis C-methylase UbiE
MTEPRVDCAALAAVYGEGVAQYDQIWSPIIRPAAVSVVAALELTDATRVLDVGAGTGALTATLARAAPEALVASIDPSLAMLGYARDHASAVTVAGDASMLPAADRTVDAVLLAYVLFHLPDPSRGLAEAHRVLRNGGRAGTVTWASEDAPRAALVWDETLQELEVPTLPAHGNHSGLDSEKAVEALHFGAGLHPLRTWRERIVHAFPPEDFWRMRTGCGCNRARIAAIDEGPRRDLLEEMHRRFALLDPRRDFTFSGEVICVVSEKQR